MGSYFKLGEFANLRGAFAPTMVSWFTYAALTLLCCSCGNRDAREIQHISDEIGHAFETRQFADTEKLFTSSFKCTMPDGAVLGREQFITAFKAEAEKAIPPIRVSTNLKRLDVHGDSAVSVWAEITEYSVKTARGTIYRLRYSQEFESA
jgi:hypothetical protein